MITPVDDYIVRNGGGLPRERDQPGITPTRERGEPGVATTPYERPEGKAWVGAAENAPYWSDEGVPLVQESQRTAGTRIEPGRAYGFFTDTTLCIGCKACEVACKQWNQLPAEGYHFSGVSYDNTRDLSATSWRHVQFVEQFDETRFDELGPQQIERREERPHFHAGAQELPLPDADAEALAAGRGAAHGPGPEGGPGATPAPSGAGAGAGSRAPDGAPSAASLAANLPAQFEPWGNLTTSEQWAKPGQRWLLMSDVCKHCVNAPCLEACPTGSIIRTEFDSVYVQQDVCNGCGYCQAACPFAVIEVDKHGDGKAHKCTLCYDRMKDGLEPACAKVCPTDSIQFGPVDELLERARVRVAELRGRGVPAYLYGSGRILEDDCDTGDLGGLNAFFLLVDEPEVYNLPRAAKRPSTNTATGLLTGLAAAAVLTAGTLLAFRSGKEV